MTIDSAGDDVAHRPAAALRGPPTASDPAPSKKSFVVDPRNVDVVEDLAILLRGRRGELARAYRALEEAAKDGSPRIVHWESGSANQLSIRSRRL